jgi:hypothetical protein
LYEEVDFFVCVVYQLSFAVAEISLSDAGYGRIARKPGRGALVGMFLRTIQ